MKLQEIINSLPETYDPELEKTLVVEVIALEVASLTDVLADLLAFSISEHYNELAKTILQKNYQGRRLDLNAINNSITNQGEEGYSLLHFTAQFGNKEMLLYFLDAKVPLSEDNDKQTPLHTLMFAKNLSRNDINQIILKFKEVSPDIVNKKDKFNLTALHYAAHNDNMQALEALISNGASN
jgi:ankyrin repeat protein